ATEGSIEEMKEQLQQAVLCEDYERAAKLRDQIRSMERK
ncbi:MAG: UvrB/UvrC motif-containing protein, partial [Victivallaceae bacterium]|nr:UvrB/UvrC motif-containing protein [Victivallaceae bacterium]